MVLPIYVALERVDPALLEASADLYASKVSAFLQGRSSRCRIPGVFAGVLLTFVPVAVRLRQRARSSAAPNTTMIGNVIQTAVLHQPRLPDGRGAVVHPDGQLADRRLPLRPGARHRGRARDGGRLMSAVAGTAVESHRSRSPAPVSRPGRRSQRPVGPAGVGLGGHRLAVVADHRDDRLRLQQHHGQVQHQLAGLHPASGTASCSPSPT